MKTITASRTGYFYISLKMSKKKLKVSIITEFSRSSGWTDWSSCTLHDDSECGVGWRERVSECRRSDGSTVDPSYCLQRWIEAGISQAENCKVPCMVNCKMGEWTRWSGCDVVCGRKRRRSRSRNVLKNF